MTMTNDSIFDVTAKQLGNKAQFSVNAADIALALERAHQEANRIFKYTGKGVEPTVEVKPMKIT